MFRVKDRFCWQCEQRLTDFYTSFDRFSHPVWPIFTLFRWRQLAIPVLLFGHRCFSDPIDLYVLLILICRYFDTRDWGCFTIINGVSDWPHPFVIACGGDRNRGGTGQLCACARVRFWQDSLRKDLTAGFRMCWTRWRRAMWTVSASCSRPSWPASPYSMRRKSDERERERWMWHAFLIACGRHMRYKKRTFALFWIKIIGWNAE